MNILGLISQLIGIKTLRLTLCLPLLNLTTETPALNPLSMSTAIRIEVEAEIIIKEEEVVDSVPTISILTPMHSLKAMLSSPTISILHPMHSLKAMLSFLRIFKANLRVPDLCVRYVARLDIKPWTVTTGWILHTKGGIHLQSLQQWHLLLMLLKLKLVRHGLLILELQTI